MKKKTPFHAAQILQPRRHGKVTCGLFSCLSACCSCHKQHGLETGTGWETGEGSHSNYPLTTITQTKALDGREWKIAQNKKAPEKGLCMYSTAVLGEGLMVGGREGDFKWRVGRMGGGSSTVLITICLLSLPDNPETLPQLNNVAGSREATCFVDAEERHEELLCIWCSCAGCFPVCKRKPLAYFWAEKEAVSSPGPDPACPPVSQAASQPATPCTHAAYSAIKTMLL